MKSSILVTGANGFLGRHIAKACFEAGYSVIGIGHGAWPESDWKEWGLSGWRQGDVTLESLQEFAGEPHAIFHCAGSGSVPPSLKRPLEDFQRAVVTVANTLEFIRVSSPKTRLIYPSSASVYGTVEEQPISIAAKAAPISPYGVHKWMSEQMISSYAHSFGVSAASVRFFSIYGEGLRKQLLWDACVKLTEGDPVFMGTGNEVRDWIHASDAASLMLAALDHASPQCPVVNGGSGEGVTIREILEVLAQRLDPEGRKPAFSETRQAGQPGRFIADISEATEWGWAPKLPWREKVGDYARWWKQDVQPSHPLAGTPAERVS